ncbi:hypothetical protein WA158_002564 [Blastocystis sp. Blastoise]
MFSHQAQLGTILKEIQDQDTIKECVNDVISQLEYEQYNRYLQMVDEINTLKHEKSVLEDSNLQYQNIHKEEAQRCFALKECFDKEFTKLRQQLEAKQKNMAMIDELVRHVSVLNDAIKEKDKQLDVFSNIVRENEFKMEKLFVKYAMCLRCPPPDDIYMESNKQQIFSLISDTVFSNILSYLCISDICHMRLLNKSIKARADHYVHITVDSKNENTNEIVVFDSDDDNIDETTTTTDTDYNCLVNPYPSLYTDAITNMANHITTEMENKQVLLNKEELISSLSCELDDKSNRIIDLEKKIDSLSRSISNYEECIETNKVVLTYLHTQQNKTEADRNRLAALNDQKDVIIQDLKRQIDQLKKNKK